MDEIVGDDGDEETRFNVTRLVSNVADNIDESDYSEEEEGSGVGGWMVWIGLLILVNILSSAFDWGFWIY